MERNFVDEVIIFHLLKTPYLYTIMNYNLKNIINLIFPRPTSKGRQTSNKQKNFSILSNYTPSSKNMNGNMIFNQVIKDKGVKYLKIGNLTNSPYFYKYINLDAVLLCLEYGNIQLVEPSRWQDQYERRFYEADYSKHTKNEAEDCPMLFATCVTTNRSNEAAWTLYTYGKSALGGYCVEFQLNKQKFREQLVKALEPGDKIFEGSVSYQPQYIIDNLHRKNRYKGGSPIKNKDYVKFVQRKQDIPYINNYLNLLLMKRDAFKHENETRFFVQKKNRAGVLKAQWDDKNNKGQRILLNIDWIDIIEKVYVNAREDEFAYMKLSDALKARLDEKYGKNPSPEQDKEKQMIWEERLKPIPTFIYEDSLDKPLEIE